MKVWGPKLAAVLAASVPSTMAWSAPPAGQILYMAQCVTCHQPDGGGHAELETPAIGGLDEAYLRRQLPWLKDGRRSIEGVPVAQAMVTILAELSPLEVGQVAASTLEEQAVLPPFSPDEMGNTPNGLERALHWHIHMTDGPQLSEADVLDTVAFLGTLEDETLSPSVPSSVPPGLSVPQILE